MIFKSIFPSKTILIVVVTALFFCAFSTNAGALNRDRQAHTDVQFLSEVESISSEKPFWVAFKMTMDPGWHVYWRNAGDSGLAPKVVWDLPQGFQTSEIQWPYPHRIDIEPLTSYGYEDEVMFFIEITPDADVAQRGDVLLKARVDFLTCELECVPGRVFLDLSLPVTNAQSSRYSIYKKEFDHWREKLAQINNRFNVQAYRLDDQTIELAFARPNDLNGVIDVVEFYPYLAKQFSHTAPQPFVKTESEMTLSLELSDLLNDPTDLQRINGILLFKTDTRNRSYEIDIPLESKRISVASKVQRDALSLGVALFFAFLGGLILNLMPCVLPVLSIKILSLVEHAGHKKSEMVKNGVLYTLGVLLSFWFLAGLLIFLRHTGRQIGWGFQFQSPGFVLFMSYLFFIFALNLFGVFEIAVSLGARVNKGKSSPFLGGVLATIVATPCTAPFMGSALGYAMVVSVFHAFLIFTCLGLGMALPYLMLTIFPKSLKFLPKPGLWMVSLKQFFGFVFMATVIWLSWVLGIQKGVDAVIALYGGLLLSGLIVWIGGLFQKSQVKSAFGKILLGGALVISMGFLLKINTDIFKLPLIGSQTTQTNAVGDIQWENYSQELIESYRKEKRTVFLDFTASWCLSCQVNERVVFHDSRVIEQFKKHNVAAIKADWTNYDKEITAALAQYGKNSIPLYVLIPAGKKEEVILPEIITPGIVLNILEKNLVD